eukprot:Selendium_serpulae@DN3783_c0_g1_i1.p1
MIHCRPIRRAGRRVDQKQRDHQAFKLERSNVVHQVADATFTSPPPPVKRQREPSPEKGDTQAGLSKSRTSPAFIIKKRTVDGNGNRGAAAVAVDGGGTTGRSPRPNLISGYSDGDDSDGSDGSDGGGGSDSGSENLVSSEGDESRANSDSGGDRQPGGDSSGTESNKDDCGGAAEQE